MNRTYKIFKIKIEPFLSDIIGGLMWDLEISGVEERDDCIVLYAKMESNINENIISSRLKELVNEKLLEKFSIESDSLQEKNWNEEWEKNLQVVHVSEKITIKPSILDYKPTANELVILIDPKMSFGTGSHQTTQLSLRLLEKHVKSGMKVMDIGSGTGILAITAAKLGAKEVLAIDNDEWCIENGEENVLQNKINNKVKIKLAEINDINNTDFDLIIANINKNVLMEISNSVSSRLRHKGILILSGILTEDRTDIINSYSEGGLTLIEELNQDQWLALAFRSN